MISDRTDLRVRKVIKDEEDHYITIKESILKGDITILNMYVFNDRISKYVRKKLIELQEEIDESNIIVGDFNSLLSEGTDPAGRTSFKT